MYINGIVSPKSMYLYIALHTDELLIGTNRWLDFQVNYQHVLCGGSVVHVECLTLDQGVADSSQTGGTVSCP